jgi:hypothetical protein
MSIDIDGDFLIPNLTIGPRLAPDLYNPIKEQCISDKNPFNSGGVLLPVFNHDFSLSSKEWEKNKKHTKTRCVYKYICAFCEEGKRCNTELGTNNFPRRKTGSLTIEPLMYCSKHSKLITKD